ncbi:MAG: acetyl-CoA hydrolase/transferase family protein [Christensenellales bacterium]
MGVFVDAETALKAVKSGDRVVTGHAMGEPQTLIAALMARKDGLNNVEIVHMLGMGKCEYMKPEMKESFHHVSLFVGGAARKAVPAGDADFIPIHFSNIPKLFLNDILPVDVALVQASRIDKHGYMSLGISVDYTLAAVKKAKTVIVQVNKNMPRTLGEAFIHISEADYIVEHDEPLLELKAPALDEADLAIGRNCAKLINDGDTLQLGIGALPDAVLAALTDKKDLGIHSEMFSDGVMKLVKQGVINCKRKNYHNGKMIATFIMGSKELYEFLDDNPMVYMAPATYTNDSNVIAKNDNLVSINSCVQVDLAGQICSESVGLRQISATGGQVDFIRGANMSNGGKAIMALHSTTDDGKISKIVPCLDRGATVTTLRTDIGYVVTEYGIAHLANKTVRERGRQLIQIAHPDFRPKLTKEWEERYHTSF